MVIAAGALLQHHAPVIGVTGTLSLLTALDCGLWRRVGIYTRTILALSRSPSAATRWAFLLSAAGHAAGAGGLVWRAGLAPALLPCVACGGAGAAVALAHCGGGTALPGMRVSGATVLSVAIAIAATLLTWHTAEEDAMASALAFAVLLDWALLGALMVRIRQQEVWPDTRRGLVQDRRIKRDRVSCPARR